MSYKFADSLWAESGSASMSYSLLTACEQDPDPDPDPDLDPARELSANLWHVPLLCVQCTPDGGQRNCPKHVEFCSKNKFEKLVHLVGFIIRIYHDAW